ncbi:MAG: SPFH domain-containing protein [Lachnospiraceae bacterium]|nr:SPFH domain-containing protein [Lachnospiraceae bacterium]
MGFFSNNPRGGIMDVIRCDEQQYLIWKWRPHGAQLNANRRENSIRYGSPLRVKEGSVAVFLYSNQDGLTKDVIVGPADTIVDTNNMPILASIVGMAYNGGSPFQAEVYFINLAETVQTKFAVTYFTVYDSIHEEFGVPVAVRGSIDFNILDYESFIAKHRLDNFTLEDLQAQIRDSVTEFFKSVVSNAPQYYDIPVIQIERKITEIKTDNIERLRSKLSEDYGIYLRDINIAAIDIDKNSEEYRELKGITKDIKTDLIKAQGEADVKDIKGGQKLRFWTKAAETFVDIKEDAYARRKKTQREYRDEYEAEQAGRIGAAGAKIIQSFRKKDKGGSYNGGEGAPPPIPVVKYHVVLYGQPAGPFEVDSLRKMVDEGTIKENSLVWTQGMSEWAEAGTIELFQDLFSRNNQGPNFPPPIPKV